MDYLSFDVGIKNLAYCVLSPDERLKQWGIINLSNGPICQVNLRKKCEKQATYKVKNSEIEYCCTSHKGKFKKHQLKKLNSNYDLFEISKNCIESLQKLDLSSIKIVLIENQPALKNPTMKSIQMILYTFFIMDGVLNKESSIEQVYMVNARNKLKVYQGPFVICPYNDDKKNKYKKNKYLSIKYTEKMIEDETDEIKEIFDQSKKKDDLADAYLQGIYWIKK